MGLQAPQQADHHDEQHKEKNPGTRERLGLRDVGGGWLGSHGWNTRNGGRWLGHSRLYPAELLLLLKAVLAVRGAVLLPAAMMAPGIAEGRLVALCGVSWIEDFAYHLVCPQASRDRPKVAAFRDGLLETSRKKPPSSGGRKTASTTVAGSASLPPQRRRAASNRP